MLRRMLGLGLLPVVLCAQGCSLIFVSGPPEGHERLRYFDCVSNGAALAGDASWGLVDGLFAAALASADGDVNDNGEKVESGGAAALFGVAAAIHAGSLIYGVIKTDRCSSAKAHLQQRIAEEDAATKARIEELELQLGAPPTSTAVPPAEGSAPAPAAGTGQVLELVPPAAPPPAGTAVPPPPDAYTQPPPSATPPATPAPTPTPTPGAPAKP